MEGVKKVQDFLAEFKRSSNISPVPGPSSIKQPCEDSGPEADPELEILEECLKQNKHSRNLISLAISDLQSLLEECSKELKSVCENITVVKKEKSNEWFDHKVHRVCSTPYFKDSNGSPAPANKDVALRNSEGFLNLFDLPESVSWTENEKKVLLEAIRQSEIKRWTEINKNEQTPGSCDFKKKTLVELVGSRKEEYDWIKISVENFKSSRAPFECRCIWFNYLHPSINKNVWSEKEDKDLLKLVENYKGQDWDKVAGGLNTGRSAYQCFEHYTLRLRDPGNKPWTEEENATIRDCVDKFSVGGYIPWDKIAWYLDGRSPAALRIHWEHLNPQYKKGRFSLQEDIVIATGIKFFGNDYAKIADYLPNRSCVQVRARVLVLQSNQNGKPRWNSEEDLLLCELVKKYGFGKWSKISTHFVNRNAAMCRGRYKTVYKWKAKHGPDSMPSAESNAPRSYNRNLSDLWENAQKIMRGKGIDTTCEPNGHEKFVRDLSKILMLKPKVGRPPGSRKPESLDEEFFKLFSSCYAQKGGRSKNVVSQELIPYMIRDLIITLKLLNANLIFPENEESFENDFRIPEVDKVVLQFLFTQKELVKNIQESVNTIRACNGGHILYLCPPNFTTLVGLRSLLLKKQSLEEQARGETLIPYTKPSTSESSSEKEKRNSHGKFSAACMQWNKRLQFLFTWPALASKVYPNEEFPIAPASPLLFQNYGRKEVHKQEKSRKRKAKPKIDKPPEMKRAYNKTGKYKIVGDPDGVARRSSRRSAGSEVEAVK